MPNFLGTDLQVFFLFERGQEWPPVPSEGLRVEPSPGGYRVLEAPFFVRNIAVGDVVAAEADPSDVLWAGERVAWGGHQVLRVNPRDGLTCAQVIAEFSPLGVVGEELDEYQIVAVDVPPDVPLQPLKDLLVAGLVAERWWYEEACISHAWPA